MWMSFHDKMTIAEFAQEYAMMIEAQIDVSHNGRCPKIEANYNDQQNATINPLDGSVFYFFFGASRASKAWAQWILASARYPNQRMRRAYMRMFA
jgi:hypothetical protein